MKIKFSENSLPEKGQKRRKTEDRSPDNLKVFVDDRSCRNLALYEIDRVHHIHTVIILFGSTKYAAIVGYQLEAPFLAKKLFANNYNFHGSYFTRFAIVPFFAADPALDPK